MLDTKWKDFYGKTTLVRKQNLLEADDIIGLLCHNLVVGIYTAHCVVLPLAKQLKLKLKWQSNVYLEIFLENLHVFLDYFL